MCSDSDRLVGRSDEITLLGKLVTDVAAGTGAAILVRGEDGIGKTALLRAALAGAVAAGCTVAWGTADELTRSVPLGLVAEWRDQLPGGTAPGAGEPLTEFIARQCAAAPLILVAENLQWADEASAAALRDLGELTSRLPLLVVASRRLAADAAGTAESAVRGWPVLPVEALTASTGTRLLERITGGAPGPRLAGLARQAGGNPLYLRELADALVADGRIRVLDGQAELAGEDGPDAVIPLPPALAARARDRVAELGEQRAATLRWATLLDPGFAVADLAVITGSGDGEVRDAMSAAAAAGILTVAGNRAMFRHGVLRRALYEGMPESVRTALRLRAARALAVAGGNPSRVAAQLAAVPEIRQEWAADWLTDAAPALLSEAPGLAAELLGRVVAGLADDDPRREELQAAQVTAAFFLDRYEEAERVGLHVLAKTRDAGRATEVSWLVANARLRAGRPGDALAAVTAALDWPGMRESRIARLEAVRALALAELGPAGPSADITSARDLAAAALTEAERAGDKLGTALALQALSQASLLRSDHATRLEALDRALAVLGDDPEATGLRLQLLVRRSEALRRLGRPAEALTAAEQTMRNAGRAGRLTWLARGELAATHFAAGRWDHAVAELGLAADPAAPAWHRHLVSGYRALIAVSRDDDAELSAHLGRVREVPVEDLRCRPNANAATILRARALATERAGRVSEAAGELAGILDGPWARVLGLVSEVLPLLTRLALAAEDRPVAEAAAAAAIAAAAAVRPERLPGMMAIADHCRGLIAADPALVLAAASGYQSADGPHDRALALEDAADLLAGRGEATAARARLRDAIGVYTGLGARWDIRRAEARLHARGVRRSHHAGRRGPGQAAATGWDSLTPTETRVARLVASGQSNAGIAAELLISARTVQTHVSHILTKLGARSRGEIAREAHSASAESEAAQ